MESVTVPPIPRVPKMPASGEEAPLSQAHSSCLKVTMIQASRQDAPSSDTSLSTPTMTTTPSSQKDFVVPFTSTSVAFRTELPSHFACQFYSKSATEIETKRKHLVEAGYDFGNGASIAAQLESLASSAHAQAADAESALEYQKERYADLMKNRKSTTEEYYHATDTLLQGFFQGFDTHYSQYRTTLQSIAWSHSMTGFSMQMCYYSWVSFTEFVKKRSVSFDGDIFLELQKQVDSLETSTTRGGWELELSLLHSKICSNITKAQLFRSQTLHEILRTIELIERCHPYGYVVPALLARPRVEEAGIMLAGFLDTLDDMHRSHVVDLSDSLQLLRNAYFKIGGIRKNLIRFKGLERQCNSDAKLFKTLVLFTAPLRFLDFPREVRDDIYDFLLSFPYNLSTDNWTYERKRPYRKLKHLQNLQGQDGKEDMSDPKNVWTAGSWRGRQARLWVHPLFHVSIQLRAEAAEQFYKHNSFASESLSTLTTLRLAPDFQNLITRLSLTWPSFDSFSQRALKALRNFTSLRFLKIYLSWQHLATRPENSLGGIAAFELLIDNLVPEIRPIVKIEVFEVLEHVGLQSKIEWVQLEQVEKYFHMPLIKTPTFKMLLDKKERLAFRLTNAALKLQEAHDRELSRVLLRPQVPGTIFSNNRLPRDPSWKMEAMNRLKARKDRRHRQEHVPAVRLIDASEIKSRLEEVKNNIRERRLERIDWVNYVKRERELLKGLVVSEAGETSAWMNDDADDCLLYLRDLLDESVPDAFWGSFNEYFDS